MDINILIWDILKVFFFIIHATYLFLNIQIFFENINVILGQSYKTVIYRKVKHRIFPLKDVTKYSFSECLIISKLK